ncbi:MAG TPA: KTSC domain-containing protein [Verrucomicrobiae bacterium]|nr:KTSC domain-containing protein [Verrucomicrobiae bacterium]
MWGAMGSSSAITRVLYDASQRTLAVTFTSGKKYIYEDVPADVALEFQTAPSQGAYFNWRIRDQYEFREL